MHRIVAPVVLAALAAVAAASTAAAPPAAERFYALVDREWEARLEESPLFATSVGRHEWNDRLPSAARQDVDRRAALWQGMLAELDAIPRGDLERGDQINYDIFRRQLDNRVRGHRFGGHRIPINADSGFHTGFARLAEEVPLATVADYENYVARLRAFPTWVGQHVANMRDGVAAGMTLPRVVLDGYEASIAAHVVDDPEQSVFWPPFADFPPGVPAPEHERLRAAGRAAILEGAVPGYRAFLDFMVGEYIPAARATLGASELPDGRAYYQHLIGVFTTLDLTPEEIHKIGLAEVDRIRAEMLGVIAETGFEGDLAAFIDFLRTDPRFYAETPEELLKEASYLAKKMDARMPALFKTLPRLPYGVAPVPDHIAPKYTSGRYVGAPLGSTQPGYYWVNTYNLKIRPLYNLPALTLHEAVPGHHHQISLNRELGELPNFRRFSYISAFGEGWGLYSEWLGLEAGFYTDPYANFGRLTYEMWRACRLVVDTGVHAMGWGRQQVIDYLAANTALPMHEIATETDRYISWPAQALSYKLGELEIKRLRRRAEEELGERFDVREFHDAVLLNGSVPLPVLAESVERYIADTLAAPAG